MFLTHDDVEVALEEAVVVAELAVGVTVGVRLPVLEPQQHEGDTGTPQLLVDVAEVRLGPDLGQRRASWEQQRLEGLVVEVLGQRPAQPRFFGPPEVVSHRRVRDAQRDTDLAAGEALAQGKSENVSNLSHGETGSGQVNLLGVMSEAGCLPPSPHASSTRPPSGCTKTPEWVYGFDQNGCTKSAGIRTVAERDQI